MVVARTGSNRLGRWSLACALTAGAVVAAVTSAGATGTTGTTGVRPPVCEAARNQVPGDPAAHRRGYVCAGTGDLIDVTLDQLHPTQAVLGFDEIYYKLGRYGGHKDEDAGGFNKRFDDWCETNGQEAAARVPTGARLNDPASFSCTVPAGQETPDTLAEMKKVVIGPGGGLYLTDGHHTLTAFQESPDGGPGTHIRLRVTGNLSDLPDGAFWKKMRDNRWVWLRDENDQPIGEDRLPNRLGLTNFRDDPYRGLVYFTRDIGYEVPADAPEFLEFSWGSWLRKGFDLHDYDLTDAPTYLRLVKATSQAMTGLDDGDVVDDGATAKELGKMAKWNDGKDQDGGEFAKLGRPITAPEPGKLAYALDYRAGLPVPPNRN